MPDETGLPRSPEEWEGDVGEAGIRQAIGELRGFANALRRRNSGLTAAQLDCVCDLAAAFLDRRPVVPAETGDQP